MSLAYDKYLLALDRMPEGFTCYEIVFDAEGKPDDFIFCEANKAFEKMAGLGRKELLGVKLSGVAPHFYKSILKKLHQYDDKNCEDISFNYEYYSKNWKCWLEINACIDEKKLLLVYYRDISENKKLAKWIEKNKQFRESHQRLLTVLDSIEAIVYVADLDTYEILFLNRYGRKIHGNLKGTKCYEQLQGKSGPCEFCTNDKLLKKDGSPAGLYRWEHKITRSGRWFECRDRAIRWIDGRLVRLEIATEITDRKKTEEALQKQLGFEKMVSEILSGFISGTRTLSESVSHALKLTGEYFNLDRSYIFQYSQDGKIMDNTYEWCAEGIEPQRNRINKFPVSSMPWWDSEILNKDHIFVPDVDKLPREAEAEKQEFKLQGIKTILAVPVKNDGRVTGFVGFDSVREKKVWTDNNLYLLKVVAELISNTFSKHLVEEALRENSARNRELSVMLESLFDAIPDILGIQDRDHRIVRYNRAGYDFLNKEPEEIGDSKCFELIGRDKPCETCATSEVYKTKKAANVEKYFPEFDVWMDVRAYPILDENGEIVRIIEHIRDITESKRHEDQLKYLSLHDNLTDIFNRAYFENELRRLEGSREYPVTILSTDMDGLKLINDTMSHSKGDELLKNCANLLRKSLRKSDVLARVGGDEFVAILQRTDAKTGEKVVERIRKQVALYNSDNKHLPISVSIGLATAYDTSKSLEKTFKEADDQMYKDKLHKGASARSQIIDALLVALGERDFITQGHVERLAEMCEKVGQKVGLSSRQINDIVLLSRVHDLGKVGIPDNILFKEGPLTEEEWEVMRRHSEKGYRISLSSPDLSSVADLTLKHHESWDGSGYPLGMKGKDIPVECRILAIADAYDAMTNERPYKRTKTKEEAIAELKRCAGKQFDPELVEVFLSVLEEED